MNKTMTRLWALLLCLCMLFGEVQTTRAEEAVSETEEAVIPETEAEETVEEAAELFPGEEILQEEEEPATAEAAKAYPTSISFVDTSFTMQKTDAVKRPFEVRIEPEGVEAEITWSVDDESILRVFTTGTSTGQIEGVSEGTTNLVATIQGQDGTELSARLPVTVIDTAIRVSFWNESTGEQVFWRWAEYGVEYTLPECPFIREGYSFLTWTTDNSSSGYGGTTYPDEGTIVVEKGMANIGKIALYLYARWKPITYTITYIDEGERTDHGSSNSKYNPSQYTVETEFYIETTTRKGWWQTGWIVNGDPENVINGLKLFNGKYSSDPRMMEDLVLTAVWEPVQYTVSFSAGGGEGEMESLTGTVDDIVMVPACGFVRNGYAFTGWKDQNNKTYEAGGTIVFADEAENEYLEFEHPTFTEANKTLTAGWQRETYSITYILDGGTNASGNPSTYNVDTGTKTLQAPKKSGWTFAGWYNGDEQVTTIGGGATGNLTLTAHWTQNEYLFTFDGNGNGQVTSETCVYPDTVVLPVPAEREGYLFTAWNTNADGSGVSYEAGAQIVINENSSLTRTFYAQWVRNVRTVSFDGNGADDGTMTGLTVESGGFVPVPAPAYTKTGYDFAGWNTAADGTGTAYAVGDRIAFAELEDTVTTLYAQWNAISYRITYVLNGGTNSENNPETYQVGPYFSFYTANKTGYTFRGWYSDAAFTELFSGVPENHTGDITVYAKWEARTGTTTFVGNGGSMMEYNASSGAYTSITSYQRPVTYGEPIPANEFENRGYVFVGWNTRANGSGTWVEDRAPYLLSSGMYVTLYAQWSTGQFNVTYRLDGGKNNADNPSVYYGGYAKPLYDPTRTGYTFAGWYMDAAFTDGPYTGIPATASGALTLFARWTPNVYTLVFDGNGADSGSMESLVCEYGQACRLPKRGYSKTGCAFVEWNTKADGSGTAYADEKEVKNLKVSGSLRLYAQWEEGTFTVVFYGNDASAGTMEQQHCSLDTETPLTKNAFTRTGHTFTGWNTAADGSGTAYTDEQNVSGTSKLVLYAQWKVNTYQISFYKNGGTSGSMTKLTCEYGTSYTLPENMIKRTGYTFTGWNTKADGSGTAYADKASVKNLRTSDGLTVILYAQWKVNTYKISFYTNGGTSGSMTKLTCKYGTSYTLPKNTIKRTGYTFTGWNTKRDGSGTAYADEATVKNLRTSDGATVIFYAQWKVNKYTIVFKGNGAASGTMADKTCSYPTSYTLPANAFKKTGYTFAGWNTKADGSGTAYADKATVSKLKSASGAKVYLYAQWTVNKYKIVFNGNGETSGTMAAKTCSYGTSYTLTANAFKRTGWVFTGWNTKANGSGTAYANKQTVKSLSSKNGATVTLYAQWKPAQMTMKSRRSAYDENQLRFYEVEGVSGYEIWRSTSKTGTYSLLKRAWASQMGSTTGFEESYDTSGDTTRIVYVYNDWKVDAGKTYYYKIRAFRLDAEKNKVYGAFSAVHTIKTALKPVLDGYMVNQDGYSKWCEMVLINKGPQAVTLVNQVNFRCSVKPNSNRWTSKARSISPTTVSAKTTETISIMLEEERLFLTSEVMTAAFYFWYDGCVYLGGVSKQGNMTFRGQSWLVDWE